jgi:hypothetical protein
MASSRRDLNSKSMKKPISVPPSIGVKVQVLASFRKGPLAQEGKSDAGLGVNDLDAVRLLAGVPGFHILNPGYELRVVIDVADKAEELLRRIGQHLRHPVDSH